MDEQNGQETKEQANENVQDVEVDEESPTSNESKFGSFLSGLFGGKKESEKNKVSEKLDKKKKEAKVKLMVKIGGFILSNLPTILIAFLVLVAVLVIKESISQMVPWLFSSDNNVDNNYTVNSNYGVTGKDFYGVRYVFKNGNLDRAEILNEYNDFVLTVVEGVFDDIETVNYDSQDYALSEFNVNVEVLVDDNNYEFSNFETDENAETKFQTANLEYYTLLKSMAEKTYNTDNETTATGKTLVEYLDGIKYFGFKKDDVKDLVSQYILNNYSFVAKDNSQVVVVDNDIINGIKNLIETDLSSKINSVINSINVSRSEKLYFKDYILETSSDRVNGVEKQNYVSMIFMPKSNVAFSYLSFYAIDCVDDFNIELYNGNKKINLSLEDNSVEGHKLLNYFTSTNLSETINQYSHLDTADLKKYSITTSLFNAIEDDTLNGFIVKKDDVYQINYDSIYLKLDNGESSYNIIENETKIK